MRASSTSQNVLSKAVFCATRGIANEVHDIGHHLSRRWDRSDHGSTDPGELHDAGRDAPLMHPHRGDLNRGLAGCGDAPVVSKSMTTTGSKSPPRRLAFSLSRPDNGRHISTARFECELYHVLSFPLAVMVAPIRGSAHKSPTKHEIGAVAVVRGPWRVVRWNMAHWRG